MSEWQPIEALKDDVVAILYQPKNEDKFQVEGMIIGSIERGKHLWIYPAMIDGYEWDCGLENPTHWMPLPEPPK